MTRIEQTVDLPKYSLKLRICPPVVKSDQIKRRTQKRKGTQAMARNSPNLPRPIQRNYGLGRVWLLNLIAYFNLFLNGPVEI